MGRPTQSRCDVTTLEYDTVLGLECAHVFVQAGVSWKRGRRFPDHLQLLRGTNRVPLVLGDHAHKIAFSNHARPRNLTEGSFVYIQYLRAGPVHPLAPWADHAAMQHPGDAHVLHVGVLGADLRGSIVTREIRAHDLVLGGRLHRRRAGEGHVERLVADQLAVAHGTART